MASHDLDATSDDEAQQEEQRASKVARTDAFGADGASASEGQVGVPQETQLEPPEEDSQWVREQDQSAEVATQPYSPNAALATLQHVAEAPTKAEADTPLSPTLSPATPAGSELASSGTASNGVGGQAVVLANAAAKDDFGSEFGSDDAGPSGS